MINAYADHIWVFGIGITWTLLSNHLFRGSFHHKGHTVPAGEGAVHTSCVLLVSSPPFWGLHKQTYANHSSRSQSQLSHSAANEVRLWTLGSLNPCLMWVT